MTGTAICPDRLLALARQGNAEAMGELLSLYTRYLKLLAQVQIGRRLRVKADASDLVQETCLEAHRHFSQFRGTTEPEFIAWLRGILATRLALLVRHFLGTRGRDIRLECELAEQIEQTSGILSHGLAAPQSTPSGEAARREQAVLLADALERLPEHYRQVIIYRHLEGLPFGEVARLLGRSEDSVQKIWLRALAGLRHSLRGKV